MQTEHSEIAITDLEFLEDYYSPEMLFILTVRSSIHKGRILSIGLPDLTDGYFAVCAGDIPGENRLSLYGESMPFLAEDTVSYRGEPILLLAGPDRDTLREMADATAVEYVEEEAVLDPDESSRSKNLIYNYKSGNCSRAFKEAFRIIEGEYNVSVQSLCNFRPQCIVCISDNEGGFIIYAPSLYPHNTRDTVANLLGLSPRKLRVIVSDITHCAAGLGYTTLAAGHAGLLAFHSGRPVKLTYDFEESLRFCPKRFPINFHYKTAIDQEGNLKAIDVLLKMDAGAYSILAPQAMERAALSACGIYSCANVKVKTCIYNTNKPPFYGFSGFGEPHAAFAVESQMDKIAEAANLDPYTWKKNNLVQPDGLLPAGGKVSGSDKPLRVLEDVVERSDFQRKFAAFEAAKKHREDSFDSQTSRRGIGLAFAFHGIGSFPQAQVEPSSFKTVFNTNKKLLCYSSFVGSEKLYKQIASGILSIPETDIYVHGTDTASVPDSGPSIGARPIFIGCHLLHQCCEVIKKKRIRILPPIEVRKKYTQKDRVLWNPETRKGDPYPALCWEATVVEIELDPVTLTPQCKFVWVSLGTVYDAERRSAEAEVETAVVKELSAATLEILNESEDISKRCLTYSPLETPLVEVNILTSSESGAAATGFGDQAVTCLTPAFSAAVSQAMGVSINQIPVTPEMLDSMQEE